MPESERVYFIKRRRTTNAEILTVPVRAHTHHAHDHAEVGKQARGRNCGRVGEVKSGEPRELCVCVPFVSEKPPAGPGVYIYVILYVN